MTVPPRLVGLALLPAVPAAALVLVLSERRRPRGRRLLREWLRNVRGLAAESLSTVWTGRYPWER